MCSPSMLLFRQRTARLPAICSSHLIPFSLTLSSIMLSLSEDQSNMEWVDGSVGLFVQTLVQQGNLDQCLVLGRLLGRVLGTNLVDLDNSETFVCH